MCTCVQTITTPKLVKARKDYRDSNREWIMEWLDSLRRNDFLSKKPKLTFKQWRLIAERIRDNWIIKKGTVHEHSVLKMDDVYSWRTMPGLDEICIKYELWPEC